MVTPLTGLIILLQQALSMKEYFLLEIQLGFFLDNLPL